MPTQVTIVGGGSYQWGPELMADLFGTPALSGMHLVLEDIDPAPLPKMEALAHKLNEAMGAKATVATTTDLPESLDGADFVIVCISTGGFRSMAVDLEVPAAHGITQTVGDTVGPGGINRALRNVPVLVGIGKAMEERCPDAWLFNITNPMTALTRGVCRETSIKTVGLCHEVGNFCMDLAIALGRPFEAVSASVTGVNHFPVLTSLEVDGADGFDALRGLVDEVGGLESLAPYPGRPEADKFSKLDFAERHLFKLTLLDRWGTFPAAGDRHIAEFVSFALTPESDWGAAYNIALSPISRREQHQAEYVADVDAWLAGTKDLQTWQSGELPSPMIQAMLTGEPFEAPVNIPNTGQAVGLPADAVIESICVIDGDGIRGRDRTALPSPYDEIVRRQVATQELTVEAALRGDRTLAAEAFALDPLAGRGDLRTTDAMVDELLSGTAEWLPQFASRPTGTSGGTPMRIGFIGLGAMGLPMAGHLVRAGHEVTVASRGRGPIDVAVAQGAADGGSPLGVAEASDVIILCVPNSPEVEEVVGAMLPALDAGKTVVDCSTIDPEVERAQHDRVAETGARYLDAPLSGGTGGAQKGTLTLMVGGDAATLADTEPAFEAFAGLVVHVGGPGMGQVVKLCNQVIYAAQMTATAEATAMAVRSGVDMEKLLLVLTHATGDCVAVRTRLPVPGVIPESPASNGWQPGFMTDLMAKDLDLAMAYAVRCGVPVPTTATARQLLTAASAAGYGREDFSAVAKVVLALAGGQ